MYTSFFKSGFFFTFTSHFQCLFFSLFIKLSVHSFRWLDKFLPKSYGITVFFKEIITATWTCAKPQEVLDHRSAPLPLFQRYFSFTWSQTGYCVLQRWKSEPQQVVWLLTKMFLKNHRCNPNLVWLLGRSLERQTSVRLSYFTNCKSQTDSIIKSFFFLLHSERSHLVRHTLGSIGSAICDLVPSCVETKPDHLLISASHVLRGRRWRQHQSSMYKQHRLFWA